MCVLAAYVGNEPAAPILLDMLTRMEGLGGGYYTGLATVHEGQLHFEKVVGDVATLKAETAALDLPGTVGIAHSRTPSGGDREWGHPFIGNGGKLAYVANGALGQYPTDFAAAGNALLAAGCRFRSAVPEDVPPYPRLLDGNCVHFSEVMCLEIEHNLAESQSLRAAAAAAVEQWPSEIVALALQAGHLAEFAAIRLNQPLVVARRGDDFYAATTRLGFPGQMDWLMPMPPNISATVATSGVHLASLKGVKPVAELPPLPAVLDVLVPALQREPQSIGALCALTDPLWSQGAIPQAAMLVYETVASLLKEGKVQLVTTRVPGMFGQGTVPQTKVKWEG